MALLNKDTKDKIVKYVNDFYRCDHRTPSVREIAAGLGIGKFPTGITQNVGDFLRSEEIEGILGNSDFVYLLNQNAKDQVILADKLGLSEKQLEHVTNSEAGSGLILFNDIIIPFADKYPTDTKTYRILTTRPSEMEET